MPAAKPSNRKCFIGSSLCSSFSIRASWLPNITNSQNGWISSKVPFSLFFPFFLQMSTNISLFHLHLLCHARRCDKYLFCSFVHHGNVIKDVQFGVPGNRLLIDRLSHTSSIGILPSPSLNRVTLFRFSIVSTASLSSAVLWRWFSLRLKSCHRLASLCSVASVYCVSSKSQSEWILFDRNFISLPIMCMILFCRFCFAWLGSAFLACDNCDTVDTGERWAIWCVRLQTPYVPSSPYSQSSFFSYSLLPSSARNSLVNDSRKALAVISIRPGRHFSPFPR